MENRIFFRAGIKKHIRSLAGIAVLLFLAVLSLCTVLMIYINGNRYIENELVRTGFGNLTAWVSELSDSDLNSLADSIGKQEGVAGVQVQKLLFSDYEGNGLESDSEGQLILWDSIEGRYRFFQDDLSGYSDAPDEIMPGQVYVSPSMVSIMKLKIGDTVLFSVARGGQNVSLQVAGYYEDPFMGSSMIGMKGFLISESDYDEILGTVMVEGIDALTRKGAMIHIRIDEDSGITVSDAERILYENTRILEYAGFIHSADTISSFMSILQNAFCGLLAAFAIVLLGVTVIVLGHSISGVIEQDWKNLGILKTIGFTGKSLVWIQMLQYGAGVTVGMFFGIMASVPTAGVISRMIVTTSGFLVPISFPVHLFAGIFIFLIFMIGCFTVVRLGHIHSIKPMEAIRGERQTDLQQRETGAHHKIRAEGLVFHLAVRQFMSGKWRYASTCMAAALLVLFASLAGRMNDWLGPDGKGMMDAFNPSDLDIGVQVMGDLNAEEMEQAVRMYSQITESYALAMPSVSVNGTNYTANVITEPERFHISRGKTCQNPDEIVLTEMLASDLGVDVGESVALRGDFGKREFIVSGIYHCANDMGANLGMNREGYLMIGQDDPRIWCYHYFLEDVSRKQEITEYLENRYGGDVHVHENTWPGLSGIITAMHMLLAFMYAMSAVFICIVTVMAGAKILEAERKDLGIYKSIGCSVQMMRTAFSLRFFMTAAVGSVLGTAAAALSADFLISAVMRVMGISNFSSSPSLGNLLFPGAAVTVMFFAAAYLESGKIKKEDMTVLLME